MTQHDAAQEQTLFDRVGGHETFRRIVAVFFDEIRQDAELAAMYPQDDMAGAEERLLLFVEQRWGGPPGYSRSRGMPRLKMRHMPYRITEDMRARWVACMNRAVDSVDLPEADDRALREHAERTARYLVNAD